MEVPRATIQSVIDKVDTATGFYESLVEADLVNITQTEHDAFKLLSSLMDELQRYCDDCPPWKS